MMDHHNSLPTVMKVFLGIAALLLFQSCADQAGSDTDNKTGSVPIEDEVRKAVETAYDLYTKSDLRWVDFYNDTYLVAADDGTILTQYADSLRAQWEQIYKNYNVIVLEHGKPTIMASGDQALHYNTAHELFINKATKDTTDNAGTWIALWQKQHNDTWKIVFETYQR